MKAMLFAAGLGTRLKPFTDHHPKALAQVNGKTLLELNIRYLQRFGINEVVVNVHHFADQIIQQLLDNDGFGSKFSISDEQDAVLETGGGLKKAAPFFEGEEDFVVLNVDALTTLDLGKLIDSHKASGTLATLAVMDRPSSRNLLFDEQMLLCGWRNNGTGEEKTARVKDAKTGFAFSGVQVLQGALLPMIKQEGKFSMIDVYLSLAKDGQQIKGFDHTGDVFIDVGKPETLKQAEVIFK